MPPRFRGVQYTFHGVGQGLFASGALGDYRYGEWMGSRDVGDVKFQWVYDCGTSSGEALIKDAIGTFVKSQHGTACSLGLLVLSHFDSDHISGVVRLLEKFEVDVLLLPYVPLGTRLLLAIEEGIGAQDPLLNFFINPVAYLRGAGIRGIRRVVFVEGGNARDGGENPNEVPSPRPSEPSEWPDGEFQLKFEGRSISDVEPELDEACNGDVFLLSPGRALRIESFWEFVPHNDIYQGEIPIEKFKSDVAEISEGLRQAKDDDTRGGVLQELKNRYDQEFGKHATARNRISLFLYAGPVRRRHFDEGRMNHWAMRTVDQRFKRYGIVRNDEWFERYGFVTVRARHGYVHGSILYTGDGYLNTDERIAALKRCLQDERFDAIAVCQVMHHGAKTNWLPGLAADINPYFSVFSSNPEAKKPGHPHADVLRDFWCHGPVQVEKQAKLMFHFWWDENRTAIES